MTIEARSLYTIGHSQHSLLMLFHLLHDERIDVIVDVRSSPISAYVPHFDRDSLEVTSQLTGVDYQFLGAELGGRPRSRDFYDAEGHVLYWKLAETSSFHRALDRLRELAATRTAAVMCAEENPVFCHRRLLLGRPLAARGIELRHIRGDGRVQTEQDLLEEAARDANVVQDGFDGFIDQRKQWRSIRSVWRGEPPRTSSRRS